MIRVKIPATSANLGAGFDCLGLAVDLYNYVDMDFCDHVVISSSDNTPVPTGKNNLIYSSAEHLFELCGKKLDGLKIIQQNNIPMTRGLGSSSACIIGGLVGANTLLGNQFSKDELVNIASEIEGHPDNTTPALHGGIVTAVLDDSKVFWVKQEVKNRLKLIAIIPDFQLSTVEARKCLPNQVSHMDARYNLSRAALFSASLLQGKFENIKVAVNDKLHQPYRMGLIKNGKEVFQKAYGLDAYGVYISGAGPTIMAMIDDDNTIFVNEMRAYLNSLGLTGWEMKELAIDNIGTTVENVK
ncbi:homoserine kinase [Paludicola sp. MB14-C6]|uniref:homoserine kinase n=1 Tax=Paludihabitans sp. MB14-C6 TaxID=3070656 RepID=UPI0027DD5CDA|nr:homoserine kinase [Paludicola sp. MB14-C6]WMJ23619.1 homoserine kinase [Paludicola sp. MB14-C6]